jgi:hypothetical protein
MFGCLKLSQPVPGAACIRASFLVVVRLQGAMFSKVKVSRSRICTWKLPVDCAHCVYRHSAPMAARWPEIYPAILVVCLQTWPVATMRGHILMHVHMRMQAVEEPQAAACQACPVQTHATLPHSSRAVHTEAVIRLPSCGQSCSQGSYGMY